MICHVSFVVMPPCGLPTARHRRLDHQARLGRVYCILATLMLWLRYYKRRKTQGRIQSRRGHPTTSKVTLCAPEAIGDSDSAFEVGLCAIGVEAWLHHEAIELNS